MFHVEHSQRLEGVFRAAHWKVPAGFLEKAALHLDLVYRWNAVHDLTAVPPADAAERHVLDSLYPFSAVERPLSLLDVGTGAGFPGIPLALWWPQTQVTLMEPLRKRRAFLENACSRLGLDCSIVSDPLEKWKGQLFDLVCSRATLPWASLMTHAWEVLQPGGLLVGLLGPEQAPSDMDSARLAGTKWSSLRVEPYRLPSGAPRNALYATKSTT